MTRMEGLVAIVPARASSKGLPRKNMRLLAGKPLVQYAIESALGSGVFEAVYVTSDDEAVLALAKKLGASALQRPGTLADDAASIVDVVRHVEQTLVQQGLPRGEAFALLQPTSPLRTERHIVECVQVFRGGSWASVVSVCACEWPPQKALIVRRGVLEPLVDYDSLHANRQELEPAYRQNGAIWIVQWSAFNARRAFVVPPVAPYVMDRLESIDIDTMDDFQRAEQQLRQRLGKASPLTRPPPLAPSSTRQT